MRLTANWQKEAFLGDENAILSGGAGKGVYTFVKTQTVYLKYRHLITCKLYLNTPQGGLVTLKRQGEGKT